MVMGRWLTAMVEEAVDSRRTTRILFLLLYPLNSLTRWSLFFLKNKSQLSREIAPRSAILRFFTNNWAGIWHSAFLVDSIVSIVATEISSSIVWLYLIEAFSFCCLIEVNFHLLHVLPFCGQLYCYIDILSHLTLLYSNLGMYFCMALMFSRVLCFDRLA